MSLPTLRINSTKVEYIGGTGVAVILMILSIINFNIVLITLEKVSYYSSFLL